jgi:hypothetical protein
MAQAYLGNTALNQLWLGNTQINDVKRPLFYIQATGGTITTDGDYKIHTFTSTGDITFDVTQISEIQSLNQIEYLIVAGGGGGGAGQDVGGTNYKGGGGGAGGLLSGSRFVDISAYTGTIGAGGSGGYFEGANPRQALNGSNSSLFGLTAIGGGRGSGADEALNPACYLPLSGGSGGGGYNSQEFNISGLLRCAPGGNGASGTEGQGNAGGNNNTSFYTVGGAGGGGAGAVGSNGPNGNGGIGKQSAINGTLTYYAGGGAGGGTTATGGLGGGGNQFTNGAANTGGGGGAGNEATGGAGGSGVVIVRYKFQN